MRGKAFIALTAAAASLALGAAACGGGGPDITVEKGLRATGGIPIDGAGGGGLAFAEAGAEPAGGDAFTLFQQGVTTGITGQGFGSATVAADAATINVFIERFFEGLFEGEPFEEPFRDGIPEPEPFTEEDLQPIVDAFIEEGVSENDIEVVINPAGGGKFGPSGTAQVRARVTDPEGKLEPMVEAAREAADTVEGVPLFDVSVNVSVFYAVDDCGPLEQAALEAAIEDAEERAQLLAGALDKRLGNLVFATESVFSPFGPSPCDPSVLGFDELEFFGGEPFDPSQPAEVQVASTVNLTFAFE